MIIIKNIYMFYLFNFYHMGYHAIQRMCLRIKDVELD